MDIIAITILALLIIQFFLVLIMYITRLPKFLKSTYITYLIVIMISFGFLIYWILI